MDFLTIGEFNFLIFIIPGFLIVWTFRYFTESKKRGDFELLGLSFIWGLILLLLYEAYLKSLFWLDYNQEIHKLLENPYAASLFLSLFALIMGWFGAFISYRKLFRKLIDKILKFTKNKN